MLVLTMKWKYTKRFVRWFKTNYPIDIMQIVKKSKVVMEV